MEPSTPALPPRDVASQGESPPVTPADVHAAATAPDARQRLGNVRTGNLRALEAYRFLSAKQQKKGSHPEGSPPGCEDLIEACEQNAALLRIPTKDEVFSVVLINRNPATYHALRTFFQNIGDGTGMEWMRRQGNSDGDTMAKLMQHAVMVDLDRRGLLKYQREWRCLNPNMRLEAMGGTTTFPLIFWPRARIPRRKYREPA